MISTYKTAIWNGVEKDKISSLFLKNTFDSLKVEIENCIKKFPFQLDKGSKLFWMCTEMSWIGLLNSSMIRYYGSNIHTLRELSIYNEYNKSIRPDLLVSLDVSGKSVHYLLEGKLNEWKGGKRINNGKLELYYNSLKSQARSYQECFINDFENYNPIIVPFVFEWMRTARAVEDAKKYFDTYLEDTETQFCALYATEDTGMWVYGRLFPN